jgi:hypothetical protein
MLYILRLFLLTTLLKLSVFKTFKRYNYFAAMDH